jgi:helix-turn-helix protein
MEYHKMKKPTIIIHNVETNEIIEREMNSDEFAQYKIDQANAEVKQAEAETKANAKAAILERLGLTADELKLLLG